MSRSFPYIYLGFKVALNSKMAKNMINELKKANRNHDIISQVFDEKQNKLLWLLKEERIFGEHNDSVTMIVCQKRGLPHSHTLIWCKQK